VAPRHDSLSPFLKHSLALWAAGFHLNHGDKKQAAKLLQPTILPNLDRDVACALGAGVSESHAKRLAQDFSLTEDDEQAIAAKLGVPESLAHDLIERFGPKWFLG